MKPFRSWTQVGLLLAISSWTALNSAHSDDPVQPTAESSRPAAVSPDVVPDEEPKTAQPSVASEALSPEPESSLPTTTVMPPHR